eukprot:Protomagalhaensia_sp_Gyna_25__2154@NODE_216_length_4343_cov_33_149628_g168_i0_p6_GENE_NODE_216_length_4343_cov_33_149628_g168_i0NODE_216_length_4343_cov_33_149628_g168_i0_p6_ORF_typecomplete_len102_score2_05zfC3HC4_3/PF13920_6/2_7e05ProkRING_4/PF14447_6/0_04ProkRING_4/PF14447_6/6_8e03_NODE_216_length_4343_cov_33_149628_g168_i09551260
MCLICSSSAATIMVLPCRHLCLCTEVRHVRGKLPANFFAVCRSNAVKGPKVSNLSGWYVLTCVVPDIFARNLTIIAIGSDAVMRVSGSACVIDKLAHSVFI